MTTTDALEQTLELVRFGWTQNASARDGAGKETFSHSDSACCFSLYGALMRATWPEHPFLHEQSDPPWQAAEEAAWRLAKKAGMNGETNQWAYIQKWNDSPTRTKEQVEHIIRCALAEESE